ncbi:MAG: SCO family protein [bacterium]
MLNKKRSIGLTKVLWGLLVLFLLSAFGAFIFTRLPAHKNQARTQLPTYGAVPHFTLTERSGMSFGLEELEGKIWVADFIFTGCGGTCPTMTRHMAKLQAELPDDLDVKLVSITVDPLRDTPEVLSKYAETYGAERGRWFFLTGPHDEIIQIASEGFHLSAGQLPPEHSVDAALGPITHSIKFALIDQDGQIRGYYDGTEEESINALIRDIKILNKREAT